MHSKQSSQSFTLIPKNEFQDLLRDALTQCAKVSGDQTLNHTTGTAASVDYTNSRAKTNVFPFLCGKIKSRSWLAYL